MTVTLSVVDIITSDLVLVNSSNEASVSDHLYENLNVKREKIHQQFCREPDILQYLDFFISENIHQHYDSNPSV